jgi:hypothetical protein
MYELESRNMEFSDLPKNNYFYSSIANIAFSYHGHLELFARSFVLSIKANCQNEEEYMQAVDNACELMGISEYISKKFKEVKTLTPSLLAPEFRRINDIETIYFDADKVALKLLGQGLERIYENLISLAHMVISTGFDKVMKLNLKDSEVLQFFRHLRNASSHNGKFLFKSHVLDPKGNLIKPAKWGDFEIIPSLQDKPLFNKSQSNTNKYWDIGDMIDFLLDFENHYPEIKHKS